VIELRDESGFTLVEVLVVIGLMLVVLGATLTTFNQFERTQRVNQLQNDSQEQTRRAVGGLARELRSLASPTYQTPQAVEKKADYDLVFLTIDRTKPAGSLNERNIKRVRYCLGESVGAKASLVTQEQTWTTATTPVTPSTASCPDPAWPNLPNGTERSRTAAEDIVNRESSQPIWTYNDADPSRVTGVRTTLLVDVNPGASPSESRLSTGIFLRNQNRYPVAVPSATDTGTGHRVLLNGSGSSDPEGKTISSYSWYVDGNMTTPVATGIIAYWTAPGTVFPQAHSFTLRVRDPSGLEGEATVTGVVVQ